MSRQHEVGRQPAGDRRLAVSDGLHAPRHAVGDALLLGLRRPADDLLARGLDGGRNGRLGGGQAEEFAQLLRFLLLVEEGEQAAGVSAFQGYLLARGRDQHEPEGGAVPAAVVGFGQRRA